PGCGPGAGRGRPRGTAGLGSRFVQQSDCGTFGTAFAAPAGRIVRRRGDRGQGERPVRPSKSDAAAIAKAGFAGLAIQKTSTADQVAGLLRERILRGELRPGTPLREVLLAGSIGVSRNTLREALRILIQEGLVLHTVHRGITVMELSREAVADIYRVRRILE